MPSECISYQESGFFSKLIVDYLDQKKGTEYLYNRFANISNFKEQITQKSNTFTDQSRKILTQVLLDQYLGFETSVATADNIKLLAQATTFTITTGHQLNLFTGPLYFIYKIVSTINLCQQLKKAYPNYNFVPVYWMATEDHDFAEINHFTTTKNTLLQWDTLSKGPVGRLSTQGLDKVLQDFSETIGLGKHANYLKLLFKEAYLEHPNLADATRYLVNTIFKEKGLVIIDGDNRSLKKGFIPAILQELKQQTTYTNVQQTINNFEYKVPVNAREINLFYIEDNLRERIILDKGIYYVNNTNIKFSLTEIEAMVADFPERFSPNVLMRPLYQEMVLPNLCYIGGGGEIGYWLQLKQNFKAYNTVFPILLVRNSVIIAFEKEMKKIEKQKLSWADLFLNTNDLVAKKTKQWSNLNIDFSTQKQTLNNQFKALYAMALQTDASFLGAVKAQEAKQIKGLQNLEKRLLKAEKRVLDQKLQTMLSVKEILFPDDGLQERKLNFSVIYTEVGSVFFDTLYDNLDPLAQNFTCIVL